MEDTTVAEDSPKVDYEKSIKRQWLVYKNGIFGMTGGVFSFFFYTFLIIIASLGLSNSMINHSPTVMGPIVPLFVVVWLITNIIFNNSLVKIKGKDRKTNKTDILEVIDRKFSNYDFIINDDQMMRSFRPVENPLWGTIITILFDGDLMYLNITTLGRSNSTTMIHGLFNYIKAKRIARYYKQYYL